jgi:hypothetical protein
MVINPSIKAFFENTHAHSDVGSELYLAVKRLGDHRLHGGGASYAGVYCVTNNTVFCGASGMWSTFWRLRPRDVDIAIAVGARRTELGMDWVEILLFQENWPRPDLAHWALRAYDYARVGA